MSFDISYFSSIANQQVAGERIQTWQYESIDPQADVISLNYFEEMRNSLKVNDRIEVIEMNADRSVAVRRYAVTVRVNELADGTNESAILALPDAAGESTTVLTFDDVSTASTQTVVFAASSTLTSAYAVFLGTVGGTTATLALAIKTGSTPVTVYSGTYTAPIGYGQVLALTAGTATAGTTFTVSATPSGVPAGSGTLKLFLSSK